MKTSARYIIGFHFVLCKKRNGFTTKFIMSRQFVLGGGGGRRGVQIQYELCSYFGTLRTASYIQKLQRQYYNDYVIGDLPCKAGRLNMTAGPPMQKLWP